MPTFQTFRGSPDSGIVQSKTTRDLKPDECLIKLTHSGLCFTDVHFKEADMVLGHEGAGVIEAVGRDVRLFKK
jgi:Zn-dependent alcohol dehydrogenase